MNKRDEYNPEMHRRPITLSDGRYLIFYTFGDGNQETASDKNVKADKPEPEAIPQAEGERSV